MDSPARAPAGAAAATAARAAFVAVPVLSAPDAVAMRREPGGQETRDGPAGGGAGFAAAGSTVLRAGRMREGVADFGPLSRYLADPSVTDVFVNGPDDLWVDHGSGLVRQPEWSCPSEAKLRDLAIGIIARGGRHIDEATPCADVRLHDGIRVHAVLPPIAPQGTLLSIRIPPLDRPSLDTLAAAGLFGSGEEAEQARELVDNAVRGRVNVLVTGAGGSGKTTLLSALLSRAAPSERIIAVEDVAELRVEHPHFIALEARQANLEGAGGVGLERLLREALRMRPDRLVLGECRGAEIRELLLALNTGHDGGAGTLHANSLLDVPSRLEALGALAGMSPESVARQAVSAIGLILHLERRGPHRLLDAVGRFALDSHGRLDVLPGLASAAREGRSG